MIEDTDITELSDVPSDAPLSADTESETDISENIEKSDEELPDIDYDELMASDLAELIHEFPELSSLTSLTDIKNPLRYAALRDMGLSPTEAYLAARGKESRDTRSHLTGGVPKPAGAQGSTMSRKELEGARDLFFGLSDAEIQRLWRRVTK